MLLKLFLNVGIEFGPIILFLIISGYTEFFTAVSMFVVATVVAMVIGQIERKSFAWFPFYMSTESWLTYKSLATVATIIFSLYQFRLSKKERLPDSSPWGMRI